MGNDFTKEKKTYFLCVFSQGCMYNLVMTSETIYNPDNHNKLINILRENIQVRLEKDFEKSHESKCLNRILKKNKSNYLNLLYKLLWHILCLKFM